MNWSPNPPVPPPIPVSAVLMVVTALAIVLGASSRTARSAFWLGTAVFAAGVWYSMRYEGLLEMGGVVHALMGGVIALASRYVARRLAHRNGKQP